MRAGAGAGGGSARRTGGEPGDGQREAGGGGRECGPAAPPARRGRPRGAPEVMRVVMLLGTRSLSAGTREAPRLGGPLAADGRNGCPGSDSQSTTVFTELAPRRRSGSPAEAGLRLRDSAGIRPAFPTRGVRAERSTAIRRCVRVDPVRIRSRLVRPSDNSTRCAAGQAGSPALTRNRVPITTSLRVGAASRKTCRAASFSSTVVVYGFGAGLPTAPAAGSCQEACRCRESSVRSWRSSPPAQPACSPWALSPWPGRPPRVPPGRPRPLPPRPGSRPSSRRTATRCRASRRATRTSG